MIELVEQSAVLQSFIDKWLAVQPQQRIALVFVDGQRYPGHVALAALEQELLGAAYGIREPQVASAKLGWWAEELAGAATSGGRHPLTQVLFDDERAHAIASELWLAPVLAAIAQLAGEFQRARSHRKFAVGVQDVLQLFGIDPFACHRIKRSSKTPVVSALQTQPGRHGMSTKTLDQARMACIDCSQRVANMKTGN